MAERESAADAVADVVAYAKRYAAYADGRSDTDPGWPPVEAMLAMEQLRAELAAANERAQASERDAEQIHGVNLALAESNGRLAGRVNEARARLAEMGEPVPEYGLQFGGGDPWGLEEDEVAYYQQQRHAGLRVRDVYATQWRPAPEAAGAPGVLSAVETGDGGNG